MASIESLPGVSTVKPKHPEYAVEARRLQTFGTWPLWALQSPENLAKAGFYYTGFNDGVKCFCCDGGLRNWEIMDNPWEEHARWFKECKYVHDVKGQAYVEEVHKKYAVGTASTTRPETPAAAASASAAVRSRLSSASSLEHPSVQLVMSLGYSKELIEAALERIRSKSETNAMPKGAELLDTVLQMEEEEAAGGCADAVSIAGSITPAVERALVSSSKTAVPAGMSASRQSELSSAAQRTMPQLPEVQGGSKPKSPAAPDRALSERTSMPEPLPSERPLAPLQNIVFGDSPDLPDGEARFLEENRQMHKHLECKGCHQRKAEFVLLPCGHLSSCSECIPSLRNCPICAMTVKGSIRTYLC